MLADCFTKPLQGSLFKKLKAVVMGHKHIDTLEEVPSTTSQKRVEESTDLEISEDEVLDGQATDKRQTDAPAPEPAVVHTRMSYAKVVKRRVGFRPHVRFRPECKRRKALTPLTLRQ
jgi:hypothetical protein